MKILTSRNLRTEAEKTFKAVFIGRLNQIRNMSATERAAILPPIITKCAVLYCGMQKGKSSEFLANECAKFVVKYYKSIGPNEIQEAFELAAAKELPDVNLKAYAGVFTVEILGDVLTAYIDYRKRIVAKIEAVRDELEKAQREAAEKELKNAEAQEAICKEVATWIAAKNEGMPFFNSWQEIPAAYTEVALTNGIITIEAEDKKKVYLQAIEEAKKELKAQNAQTYTRGELSGDKYKEILETIKNSTHKSLKQKATAIYAKLLMWKVVKPNEL